MLCPEVLNFPPPKVVTSSKKNESFESVIKTINMNKFYKSIVLTYPDELQAPHLTEEILTEDSDYYKITNCSLKEFIEPVFIENFVKNGNLYCLSADRNCIVENCAAITPDGLLTLHVLEHIYQTLGFEGIKRPHNFYEVKIDLKCLKHYDKVKQGFDKLEQFDFFVIWEPHEDNVCPSSIAKYFSDKNIEVSVHNIEIKTLSPFVKDIPSIKDVDIEEIVEWTGMLAHGVDTKEKEPYISTYSQPESEFSLKTSRISLLIAKGFLPSSLLVNICKTISDYVISRELPNYWASISIQSQENSLWQWSRSSMNMFQAHDSSYSIFFSNEGIMTYSIGQIKYS